MLRLGTFAAATLLALPAAAQTTLNFSSFVPPAHSMIAGAVVPWGAEVEKATNGKVKVAILPKAVANPQGHFDAIHDGLADVSWIIHGYTPGRFTLTKIAEFPFLGNSSEASSIAYWRVHEQHLAKAGEHKGIKLLSLFTHGPGQPFNTKREIDQLADFDGMKIRVGGGVVNDVAKALGVVSLLKPAPESYELLANGVADGVFLPTDSIKSYKLEKLIRHATIVPGGLYNTSFALVMNEAKFNALGKAEQEALMKVSGENFARIAGRSWDKGDAAGLAVAKEGGVKIIEAPKALVDAIKAKTAPIEAAWIEQAKAKGIDAAAALAAFRAEAGKLAKGS